ncbi:MAG: hypothetical protein JWP91_1384 [Fibrobacteres bacterium]|nr:hypothetical protein [Fibrobacterota bacterium]
MTNNDILRRVRFIFDFNDSAMMELFGLAGPEVTREQVSAWMKRDDNPDFRELDAAGLAAFLNGLIIKRRGRKDGPAPEPETSLNNNVIFRKLKIALDFKDDDILAVMKDAGFPIGKHELSALFRKAEHKNFRKCQDQMLRNFLRGLQLKYRGAAAGAAADAPADDEIGDKKTEP